MGVVATLKDHELVFILASYFTPDRYYPKPDNAELHAALAAARSEVSAASAVSDIAEEDGTDSASSIQSPAKVASVDAQNQSPLNQPLTQPTNTTTQPTVTG
jgi:hypothetical protein